MKLHLDTILKAQGWKDDGYFTLTLGKAKLLSDTSHWYELYLNDKPILDIPNPDNIKLAHWTATVINKLLELSLQQ